MQTQVVRQAHERGHFGITKTEAIVKQDFWFKGLRERVNRTLIPLLTKLTAPNADEWYKHVDKVQKFLNATINRSTGKSPFQLLVGVGMRVKEDLQMKKLIDEEWTARFEEQRCELREEAKKKIGETQEQNRKTFNRGRKRAIQYQMGNLVAIKRTQFGTGLKLKGKFLGPYRILRALRNDRYMVEKVGEHEGPRQTSTTADFMKLWFVNDGDDISEDSEVEENI